MPENVFEKRGAGRRGQPGPAESPAAAAHVRASQTHSDDRELLARAVELAQRCPPSETAFSVGALVVDAGGVVLAEGWSRRRDPHDHAEESALADLGPGWRAAPGTTVYSSLEPCSARASRPLTCTELILAAGVDRVVFAWREPGLFVEGRGAELLRAGGVEVVEMPELAAAARIPNAHLLEAR